MTVAKPAVIAQHHAPLPTEPTLLYVQYTSYGVAPKIKLSKITNFLIKWAILKHMR